MTPYEEFQKRYGYNVSLDSIPDLSELKTAWDDVTTEEEFELERIRYQKLVYECLGYALRTGEPLPDQVIFELKHHMELIRCGRESYLFSTDHKVPRTHPTIVRLQKLAVSYIKTCQKCGLDKTPVKTVSERFGVAPSTVHNWKKHHSDYEDNLSIINLRSILAWASIEYRRLKQSAKKKPK